MPPIKITNFLNLCSIQKIYNQVKFSFYYVNKQPLATGVLKLIFLLTKRQYKYKLKNNSLDLDNLKGE